eukprot:CAMPEP_0175046364 /NCGR_PEP_ID=MMETSP0052_2-20121109/4994_1 /TAXON_ID=51329 ORGANISM="Polytomella parva, Strain SAG 63-3" /NCGR_SAMPLE_ID=MMETSP0052_2 /ASSEMBLY_ACC=CAM_ASM_000194 /LENGTH=76 /DNA_ID=CAMNT_0016310111 /DNA_START=444 /DNA_END=674 /DNA_ORIENTATION=+
MARTASASATAPTSSTVVLESRGIFVGTEGGCVWGSWDEDGEEVAKVLARHLGGRALSGVNKNALLATGVGLIVGI